MTILEELEILSNFMGKYLVMFIIFAHFWSAKVKGDKYERGVRPTRRQRRLRKDREQNERWKKLIKLLTSGWP